MALPPTALTDLLRTAASATDVYAVLRAHGCLSLRARLAPGRVVACVHDAIAAQQRLSAQPGWVGPTTADAAAAAVVAAGYLNERGRRLHAGSPFPERDPQG